MNKFVQTILRNDIHMYMTVCQDCKGIDLNHLKKNLQF